MDAVPLYEFLISDGAWWDVVDEVATHRFVKLLEADHDAMVKVLRRWAKSNDLWLRRSAIIAQVLRHEETELELLFELIEPAMHEKEFFLRKAIGWALRAAGTEFPREIRAYVDANATRLSGLSKREAEKSLSRGERGPRSGG
jgi:3-methyladenine DNA glycosylase AlkD